MYRIDLAQDRDECRPVVNAVMNLGVMQNAVIVLRSSGAAGFSGMTLLREVSRFMSRMWSGFRTKWKNHLLVQYKIHELVLGASGTGNGYWRSRW